MHLHYFLVLFIFTFTCNYVNSEALNEIEWPEEVTENPSHEELSNSSLDTLSIEQKLFESLTVGPLNILWGTMNDRLPHTQISPSCRSALNLTLNALQNGHQWAFALTSSVNLEKLLESTFLHMADFDRCLQVQTGSFQGKYCVADLQPFPEILVPNGNESASNSLTFNQLNNQTLSVREKISLLFKFEHQVYLKHGFCMPSACSKSDIEALLLPVLENYSWNLLRPLSCQVHQTLSQKLSVSNSSTWIAFCILTGVMTIILLCTLIDIIVIRSNGFLFGMIRCLSICRSCNKLFSTKQNHKQSFGLNVLNSLVIFVAISSHSYLYYIWLEAYVVYDKIFYHLFNTKSLFAQPFANLFDINTGLLFLIPACNACLRLYKIDNLGKFRCLKEIVAKFIRVFPMMGVLVCMQLCLPLFFTGPVANYFLERDAEFCNQNWWRNLLFINNFVDFDKQCVLHSWVISTEIQMFVILSIMIIPFKRWPSFAKVFTLILIFGSIGAILVICYTKFLPPQFIPMPLDLGLLKERAKLIHFPLYAHVFEYFLPVFVFDMIYTKNIAPFSVASRRTFTFLLIIAWVVIQFYSFPFMTMDFYGTPLLNSFIVITCKLMLPVFFSWAIYNYSTHSAKQIFEELMLHSLYNKLVKLQIMHRDYGGHNCDYMILGRVSTEKDVENTKTEHFSKMFEPIESSSEVKSSISAFKYIFLVYARLSYSLYLAHHFFLAFSLYVVRTPLSTSIFDVWARGIYDVFFMHLYAIAFYIFIESPLVVFARYLYRTFCDQLESYFSDVKFAF